MKRHRLPAASSEKAPGATRTKPPAYFRPRSLKSLALAFGAALPVLAAATTQASSPEPKPNVILIVADDLGYGDLGSYGATDIDTPHLDRLASTGVRLTQGYVSSPYCGPSRAGLMTGRYQQRHGFRTNPSNWPVDRDEGLDRDEETLGDLMQRAGYRTAVIGKWHLGAAEVFHPVNRGFDEFFGFLGGGHEYFPSDYKNSMRQWSRDHSDEQAPHLYNYATPLQVNGVELPPQKGYLTDQLTDYALGFMKRAHPDPFFIHLPYNAPHVPLQAPEETIAQYDSIEERDRRVYAAMVDNLDMNIGRILDHLESTGQRENTLVVFLSDNGGKPRNGGDNGPLRGHKGLVYEGGVRIPFILSWPRALPQGDAIQTPIISLDLFPTLAAVAGAKPEGNPLDGVNVLPWLRGDRKGDPHEALSWERGPQRAIRAGDWKAVRRSASTGWHLFNLARDVGEQNDLSGRRPDKLASMRQRFSDWYDGLPPARWEDPQY